MGAPVLDPRGIARASIAIQGPVNRLPLKRLTDLAPAVIATARRVAEVVPLDRL
jgi:IclR family acetate operon transcriptional repressor